MSLQQFTHEATQLSIHDSDMTLDSDVEEPAWKKAQITNVNINLDSIKVIPSVAAVGDEQPVEFFIHFIHHDVGQLLVSQTTVICMQKKAS